MAENLVLDESQELIPKEDENKFLILCEQHPTECIERICSQVNCRQHPLICWQCSIDSAEHVKQHRANIERLDSYLDKLQESFLNVCETRQKDAEKSNIEGLELRKNKESNIEKVQLWANDEKKKIADEIKIIKERINSKCDETQKYFNDLMDTEVNSFKENYEKMNEIIEIRYGYNTPITLQEVKENLQKENSNGKYANEYFLKIKEKLQNPIELNKNPSYMTLQSKIKLKLEKPQKFIKTDYIAKRLNESIEKLEKEIFNIKALFQRQFEQELLHQKTSSIDNHMESAYPLALASEYKKMGLQSGKKSYGGYSESNYGNYVGSQQPNDYSVKKFSKRIPDSSSKPTPLTRQLYNQIYQENESDIPDDSSSIYQFFPPPFKFILQKLIKIRSNLMDRQYYQEPTHQFSFIQTSKFQTTHTKQLNCILLIQQLGVIATGSKDKKIKIWRIGTWEKIAELDGHEDGICALATLVDQRNEVFLVSGGTNLTKYKIFLGGNFDSSLKIWDLRTFNCLQTLNGHSSSITCILSIQSSNILLSGSYDNNIMVWNSKQPSAQFILKKHSAMISCLCEVLRENNTNTVQFASASWDKSISIWVITFNGYEMVKCEYSFSVLTNSAVLAMCLIEPAILLYGGTDTLLSVYNLKTKTEIHRYQGSQFGVNELHRFDQNTILGLSANDYSLRLWDLQGNEIAVIVDPENFVMNNFNTTPKIQIFNNGKTSSCIVGNCAAGKQWVTQFSLQQN